MRTVRHLSVLMIVLAAAVVAVGCSSSDGRVEVTGNVKLVGQPIEDGTIEFKPLDKQDTMQGAQIVNGAYKIPRKQGLKPGKYLVAISSGDPKKRVGADEETGPGPSRVHMAVERVPPEWNIRSKQEVEIKSGIVNKKDFEIPNFNPKYKPKK
jgi:hypothetical protein